MELTTEDRLLLERLIQSHEAREHIPADRQIAVARADKYVFPIGLDDAGNPFPVPSGHEGGSGR